MSPPVILSSWVFPNASLFLFTSMDFHIHVTLPLQLLPSITLFPSITHVIYLFSSSTLPRSLLHPWNFLNFSFPFPLPTHKALSLYYLLALPYVVSPGNALTEWVRTLSIEKPRWGGSNPKCLCVTSGRTFSFNSQALIHCYGSGRSM